MDYTYTYEIIANHRVGAQCPLKGVLYRNGVKVEVTFGHIETEVKRELRSMAVRDATGPVVVDSGTL